MAWTEKPDSWLRPHTSTQGSPTARSTSRFHPLTCTCNDPQSCQSGHLQRQAETPEQKPTWLGQTSS